MSSETECPELSKRFVRGFLDVVVLSMLTKESLWGYRMMILLKERYSLKVGPPVIYPLLDKMENEELVASHEAKHANRVRKMYEITEKGRNILSCMKKISDEILG